jgi:hypothetical protein
MSSGALMQLVAYGAQDVYLSGNPQITFFKIVYRRHTNFSMEINEIPFNSGSNNFGGGKHSVTISRNGDLITNIYLHATLNAITGTKSSSGACAWCKRLGHALIDSVEITIGGSRVDKQYGTWLDIWYELTHTSDIERGYNKMIGNVPELTDLSFGEIVDDDKIFKNEYTMYIPLQFWFNRHNGLALPLIALQYHEVKIDFEFKTAKELICYTDNFDTSIINKASFKELNLLVNYIFLDNEERRKFAQVGHEYLIEQLQYTGSYPVPDSNDNNYNSSIVQNIDLNFNHPTKELIWVMKSGNYVDGNKFLGYSGSNDNEEAINYAIKNIFSHEFIFNYKKLYGNSWNELTDEIYEDKVVVDSGNKETTRTTVLNENKYYFIYPGINYLRTSDDHIMKLVLYIDEELGNEFIFDHESSKYTLNGKTYSEYIFATITTTTTTTTDSNGTQTISVSYDTDNQPFGFIMKESMMINNYNLFDKIDEIKIYISVHDLKSKEYDEIISMSVNDITESTFQTFYNSLLSASNLNVEIIPIRHHMTIKDISIPVSNYNTSTWDDFTAPNVFNDYSNIIVRDHCNYGIMLDGSVNPIHEAIIQFNGHDRFERREGSYFNYVQPHEHHTRTPKDGINVYSFALNPENHQPSGTANLSRIDSTRLNITYKDPTRVKSVMSNTKPNVPVFNSASRLYVFDVNYNVLRILSGMGGLAYSN